MIRLHYLDNLRWIAILLLFPFHAAFIFCAGWYGYYVLSPDSSVAAHCLTVAIEPWIMPLLFCIAGMSARFALQKRTPLQFLKERVTRLLVPFLAGLVIICPVIAYFALRFHEGYTGGFLGAAVHFFSSAAAIPDTNGLMGDFSVDHLWFILFLFVFSLAVLCLILLWQRLGAPRWRPAGAEGAGGAVLLLVFVPVWLLNFAGITVTGYSIPAYFALFLAGYGLAAGEPAQAWLERHWRPLLAAWVILTAGVMWIGGIALGHGEFFWGSSPLFVLTGWAGVLALLGAGRHFLGFGNRFTAYLGAASYPVYIIHQAVLVAVAYSVLLLAIPPAVQYAAIVITSLLLTFGCYEVIRRIPGVRVLFGITDRSIPGRDCEQSPSRE